MNSQSDSHCWPFMLVLVAVLFPASIFARPETDACIALGALAYDDWTRIDSGGSGLPAAEPLRDYVRCKSCHGWDRLGLNGGYVRRSRAAERPNAGLGDLSNASRDIAPGLGDYYHVRAEEILRAGTGRSFADGSGSWVPLDPDTSPENIAAHVYGYSLGNLHPDFSHAGANGGDIVPTADQIDCLALFINHGDADPRFYFQFINVDANPVEYVMHSGANASAGRSFYQGACLACHGEPNDDHQGANDGQPEGGIHRWLEGDGRMSELVHKARWGIPDTVMTRLAIGEPDAQDIINLALYLQEFDSASGDFLITDGISGTWYLPDRDGEGFVLDVAPRDGGLYDVVATFYTYDGTGNQTWLIGNAMAEGDTARVPVVMADGGVFGTAFDPTTVERHEWGTLLFRFTSCTAGHVWVEPNGDMMTSDLGYEPIDYALIRLTPPGGCL